ncbi:MAG TPA: hypothetical protein VFN78_12545 [Ktedonobacterales bacterium]|nr:hypothetical protein [Ktedonobacterales bacterium]
MRKPQITRLWLIGVIVSVAGLIVAGISMGLMFGYGGEYVRATSGNGYDFTPHTDSFFWTTVAFMIVGGVIALGGGVAQLVAWVGALVNTYAIPDRTWFVVLLVGGLIGLAFGLAQLAVMIAYVVAGPDGMALPAAPRQYAEPPMPPRAPTLAQT